MKKIWNQLGHSLFAEDESSRLFVSTFALEILEIYLVSAVSYSSQFVFYHLATTVFDA